MKLRLTFPLLAFLMLLTVALCPASQLFFLLSACSASGKKDASRDGTEYAAIYENLLRQVYESPASFKDIQTFVSSLPQDRVPEEFQSLYEKMSKAIKSFKR